MSGKAVVSLTTGLEDPEKVTVAFLVAVAAAEQQRPTLIFLTKEAVRLAATGVIQGVACEGCPPLPELAKRYTEAGGRLLVCPICFNARHLAEDTLVENAALGGTVPLWEWIGDELVEQQVYYRTEGPRITWMRVLCSGYQPFPG